MSRLDLIVLVFFYRHPVDRMQHPDYDKIVDTPIDLSMIREELQVGNYRGPVELCKDVRLMFENAKNYTPNKRSRVSIYTLLCSIYSFPPILCKLFY